ncbi:MAG: hypothetical protein ACRDK3_07100, partial [Actinomycetota bacterium]
RDGATVVTPSEAIVPGDVIVLSAGDDVPADCRLVEGFGVRALPAKIGETLHSSVITVEGGEVSGD